MNSVNKKVNEGESRIYSNSKGPWNCEFWARNIFAKCSMSFHRFATCGLSQRVPLIAHNPKSEILPPVPIALESIRLAGSKSGLRGNLDLQIWIMMFVPIRLLSPSLSLYAIMHAWQPPLWLRALSECLKKIKLDFILTTRNLDSTKEILKKNIFKPNCRITWNGNVM